MGGFKRITRYSCLGAGAAVLLIASLVLRGPHVSNYLKKLILPELEHATGQKVIAQKIYVNLLPLFVEAKGVKVFDEQGEKILVASRVKAYIEPTGFLRKNLVIRRLVVKEPDITAGREKINEIIETFKTYMSTEMALPLKPDIRAIEIKEGSVQYEDPTYDFACAVQKISAEMLFGRTQKMKMSSPHLTVKKKGYPDITVKTVSSLVLHNGTVEIENIAIDTLGSAVQGSGEYRDARLDMKTDFTLLAKTVKEMLGLKQKDEGKLNGKGSIRYADKRFIVDLILGGNLYLETLMEVLGVKERLEGFVEFSGELKGPLDTLVGKGRATMIKGNLFSVDIDRVSCLITYADGVMRFTEGDGRLYHGLAKASVSITLPHVDFYTVDVAFSDVDSPALFKLIRWDPGIHPGKVTGSLSSSGAEFNPRGQFEYRAGREEGDILSRVRSMSGTYDMQGHVLALSALRITSDTSTLEADGAVDTKQETLSFQTKIRSDDIADIARPYYEKLRGTGEFSGTVGGTFTAPLLKGTAIIRNPVIEGYSAEYIEADVVYRMDALTVARLIMVNGNQKLHVDGVVSFRNARDFLDLSGTRYQLNVSVQNADLEKISSMYGGSIRLRGGMRADVKVNGSDRSPEITGTATLEPFSVQEIPFDSGSFSMAYKDGKLRLDAVRLRKGKTHIAAEGSLDPDERFFFKASTERCYLSDLVSVPMQGDAVFSLRAEGSGSFSNPAISVSGKMIEGTLRGKSVGSGFVEATVRNKDISLKADLLGDKVRISGNGRLEKDVPWNARVEIQTSRYDFLISSFLKDIPEDFIFSMNGTIDLQGDRNTIASSAVFRNVVLSLYGHSFTNEEEIRIALKNRQLHTDNMSLRSGNTFIRLAGGLTVGRKYDAVISGKTALAPFKSLFSRVGMLKGDGEFEVAVSGEWENPQVNGWLSLQNGSFGLKDYPYRLSSVNGRVNMDNDRIVLQKLTGKMGGGDITLTGILYMKKFSFRRFYVEGKMDHITVAPSNEFNINFSGILLYRGTPEEQGVSGDLTIHNARYRERVEWKSWLLKTKKAERIKADVANLEKATLNIRVAGKNAISIDNNVARTVMSADMVLRGTIGRPVLTGRLVAKEGKVYFRNNEFAILNVSADFIDPHRINPLMEISAETIVKSYKIKMNLEGQMDHFNMSLSSDPPLKEMDILALLTVGQTGVELKGLEGGIGAGEATSFVTGKIQDVIEERLKTITGLDRLQIDPYVSRTTGTVEPRVTVSKRLMGDKMFVTYTSSLGTTEEQIIKLEYFLGKNMSLVGVRDERGIVGGDVKFRFEFK